MANESLFTQALGLQKPWKVLKSEMVPNSKTKKMEMHITIGWSDGAKFPCPEANCEETKCSCYDSLKERTWRHLNFFQYKCFIHAKTPRIKCSKHGVKAVKVPWARARSGFTLLMDGFILELARHMAIKTIADEIKETDTRIWRVIELYVRNAYEKLEFSDISRIGVDEYSHRGHNYITVFMTKKEESKKSRVLFVTLGKGNDTVDEFSKKFVEKGGIKENVLVVTSDMTHGFRNAMKREFTNSTVVVDKFHVVKMVNDGVDKVRKREANEGKIEKKTKYIWLKNPENLTERQQETFTRLSKQKLGTGRAYRMRLELQAIYAEYITKDEARVRMMKLTRWMLLSRLAEMRKIAKSLRRNMEEIINYFTYRTTNAMLEGTNSVISLVKRRARGFRNMNHFRDMIYLQSAGLDLPYVTIG
jgi:transposase